MGVPKFFYWLTDRYPFIIERITQFTKLDTDNFFIDANQVIHLSYQHYVKKLEELDPYNQEPEILEEDEVFKSITDYFEFLINLAAPKKKVMIAVDGVAPQAKMNNQRARRYSKKSTPYKMRTKNGDIYLFTGNSITPGTSFMDRLNCHLKIWLKEKLSSDAKWKSLDVVYSPYTEAGEGEHKIMNYIRNGRTHKSSVAPIAGLQTDDNKLYEKSCIYGSDADIILLSLASHEYNICILREELDYKKSEKNNIQNYKIRKFNVIQIPMLRDYFKCEFSFISSKIENFHIGRVIDDLIFLMCFIGNDFLPHTPSFHIYHGSIDIIWAAYKLLLLTKKDYLVDQMKIEETNMIILFRLLASAEMRIVLSEEKSGGITKDLMEEKRQQQLDDKLLKAITNVQITESSLEKKSIRDIKSFEEEESIDDDESVTDTIDEEEENMLELEYKWFHEKRKKYYDEKFEIDFESHQILDLMITEYIKGINYVLHYYTIGVPSWTWYYPFHYSPWLIDISLFFYRHNYADYSIEGLMGKIQKYILSQPSTDDESMISRTYDHSMIYYGTYLLNLKTIIDKVNFDNKLLSTIDTIEKKQLDISIPLDEPCSFVEQMLSVLPPWCSYLLPIEVRKLTEDSSNIIDMFPNNFETDLNGKVHEWESVVLLPFPNLNRIRSALQSISYQKLKFTNSFLFRSDLTKTNETKENSMSIKFGTELSFETVNWDWADDLPSNHITTTGYNSLRGKDFDFMISYSSHERNRSTCTLKPILDLNLLTNLEEMEDDLSVELLQEFLGSFVLVNWPNTHIVQIQKMYFNSKCYSLNVTPYDKHLSWRPEPNNIVTTIINKNLAKYQWPKRGIVWPTTKNIIYIECRRFQQLRCRYNVYRKEFDYYGLVDEHNPTTFYPFQLINKLNTQTLTQDHQVTFDQLINLPALCSKENSPMYGTKLNVVKVSKSLTTKDNVVFEVEVKRYIQNEELL
ncbi:hypothetical protein SNEBB_004937, partial [Seison nebaliae]